MPNRIRELRLARLLTQAELAEKVGVNENTVAGWERGRTPRLKTQRLLAKRLRVSPAELGFTNREGEPMR